MKAMTLIKVALSVALVWWLARSIDLPHVWAAAAGLRVAPLAGAVALFVLQGLMLGWRWHRIVRMLGGQLPPRRAIEWVFVGLFFNQALPTSVGGDAIRIWNLHRSGSAQGLAFSSVTIERVTGVAALGVMITACMPAVWDPLGPALRLPLAATGPCLLALLVVLAFFDRALARWLPARIGVQLAALGGGLRRLAASPAAAIEVAAWGAAASLTGVLAAFVLGHALGIDRSLPEFIVVVGGAILLSVLPVSLGGWGVREATMATLFGALGVAPEPVISMSIIWALLPMLVSLPSGLTWWLGRAHAGAGRDADFAGQRRDAA